ncbi:MAG: xanthine dehydrogenase family protein molybdopterin-binding subunit [Spirochaetes bacterium]|nr:MAG: xanthine dehydrogenase family protein molybdopterin-binding subunit [Spirochaetota bacterium]
MAVEKVRFVGEPVAAVIADSPEIAQKGVEAIKVEYEDLPAVFDVYDAIKKDAPLVHENLGKYKVLEEFNPIPGTNIFHHYKVVKGDIEKGFKESDLIIENEYEVPHISHVQLEPHGAIAQWFSNGELKIWSSSQSPFLVRGMLAKMYNISQSKIRVIIPYLGGGFGGKSDVTIEPLVSYIARSVWGRPVALFLDREEMFYGTVLGRGCRIKLKTGVKKDGTLLCAKIELYFNAGAYGEYGVSIVKGAGHNATGPYEIKHVQVDSYGIYTNLPFIGAFRGYGHPEVHFAMERQLDIIAEKLKIDPVQLRLKNCLTPGKENLIGQIIQPHNGDISACIKAVKKELNWEKEPPKRYDIKLLKRGKIKGKAICGFMKSPVMATNAASTAVVKFNEDASVNLAVSSIDMGQGSITALAQIAAETLKIPVEKVHTVRLADTEFSPYEWQTVASRATWAMGNAVMRACMDAIDKIKDTASQVLNVSKSELVYDGEKVFIKNNPDKYILLEKLVFGYMYEDGHTIGGQIVGIGRFIYPHLTFPDKKTGRGNLAAEWTFGAQGVEIEIDLRTAEIIVNKLVTAIDAGKIVNPQMARGQIVGAMVQGLGAALTEEIIYDSNGRIRNADLTDYKIPTYCDLSHTDFRVIFIETLQEDGPYGARSLAEHAIISIPPAIANAIFYATGINFYKIPITRDRLMKELMKLKEAK